MTIFSRRILWLAAALVALVAIGIGGYLVAGDRIKGVQAQDPQYRVGVVERGDLRETVSVTGPVQAKQRADLAFMLSGQVEQINVQAGQRVRRGDVLMRLDTAQYELDLTDAELAIELQRIAFNQLLDGPSNFDVAAAQAAVTRAYAQLAQISQPPDENSVRVAQANLELRRSDLWLALVNRDSVYEQYGKGYLLDLANKEVEAAQLAVHIAEQELINAQQGVSSQNIAIAAASARQAQASLQRLLEGPNEIDVQIARLQIEQAELALERAHIALGDAELVAPFDGIVAEVRYDMGEQITPGLPAVVLLDDSAFYIDVLVDEIDIARIAKDQLVFINLDSWPGAEISGHVIHIAPDATDVGGVVSYEVRVLVDAADVTIRDGMTATVDIVVSELTQILLVPNWAIRFDRSTGKAYVNVRQPDGTIQEREIEVGVRGVDKSEVRNGLQDGEQVVVSLERELLNFSREGQ